MPQSRASQRFCHKCGAEIPEGSSYCKVCHYRVEDRSGKAEGHVEQKGK